MNNANDYNIKDHDYNIIYMIYLIIKHNNKSSSKHV